MALVRLILSTSWPAVTLAVLLSLLSGACSVGMISVVRDVIAGSPRADAAWRFMALLAAFGATSYASQAVTIPVAQLTSTRIRIELCREVLAAPLSVLEKIGATPLYAMLGEELQAVTVGMLSTGTFFVSLVVTLGCMGYIAYLSSTLFLVIVAGAGLAAVIVGLERARQWRSFKTMLATRRQVFEHVATLVNGAKELKLNRPRRTDFLNRVLNPSISALRTLSGIAHRGDASTTVLVNVAAWGTIAIVLFVSSMHRSIAQETANAVTLVLLFAVPQISALTMHSNNVGRGTLSLNAIERIRSALRGGSADEEFLFAANDPPGVRTAPRLELAGVTCSYPREDGASAFTVGPIALTILPGELVFLHGGNGSGKTTLLKVIASLYPYQAGSISLDGVPLTKENLEWYRQHFAAVFADFHLFRGIHGAAQADIQAATDRLLDAFHLSANVKLVDGEFSTLMLSRGQQKRLALISAYLDDRPIYLLDEWAADQDPEFRRRFYEELLPELKRRGKTCIVITHDDRYYHLADRLIRVNQGQLEELRVSGAVAS